MFRAPGLVFGCTVGVGFRFLVWRSQTHIGRNRGRLVQFTCFVLPDSFLAVPGVLDPIFMSYAPGIVFNGTEGDLSHFHVFRSLIRF
jgi:hypothetical protein